MVRTVVTADKNTVIVSIPEAYIGKQVEVIAFTLDEGDPLAGEKKKKASFDAIRLDTMGYKFNRDEANER
jgi:hypothetical protein